MQQSIGTVIRQLRREQNKTQTELGGTAFSKSYVSAIESGKLTPSKEALQHFALSLGKPEPYFLTLGDQMVTETRVPLPEAATLLGPEALRLLAQEKSAFLATLLAQPEYTEVHTPETFFSLSAETLTLLPLSDQAHYHFFQGLMLQQKEDYLVAIEALEQALVRESHPEHTAAILHALGKCSLQIHLPQMALSYLLRAQRTITHEPVLFSVSSLPFQIALSGGSIALALGLYQQALEQFEQARSCLNARQAIKNVGQLYWGLGYCTYALAYQQAASSNEKKEQVESLYQRALAYLLQSHSIAQMSGERHEAKSRRLTLAMVQLDLCVWRRRRSRNIERDQSSKELRQSSIASLLDDASEQCRQVLVDPHQLEDGKENISLEERQAILLALALLLRVGVQRAQLAYEQGYESTFLRERSLASAFCQQALDACQDEALLETLAWRVGNLPEPTADASLPSLPHLPEWLLQPLEETFWRDGGSQAEICFAAGEVAEMLGCTATSSEFRQKCLRTADSCFLHALEGLRGSDFYAHADAGYMTRAYQRYTALLEERLREVQEQTRDAYEIASALLALSKQQFQAPQTFFVSGADGPKARYTGHAQPEQ